MTMRRPYDPGTYHERRRIHWGRLVLTLLVFGAIVVGLGQYERITGHKLAEPLGKPSPGIDWEQVEADLGVTEVYENPIIPGKNKAVDMFPDFGSNEDNAALLEYAIASADYECDPTKYAFKGYDREGRCGGAPFYGLAPALCYYRPDRGVLNPDRA